jgi:hypothetical protein
MRANAALSEGVLASSIDRNDKFTCGFRLLINLGVFVLEGL